MDLCRTGESNLEEQKVASTTAAGRGMGRYGTAAEFAQTAAFLMPSVAGHITGRKARVDGGITRRV